MSEKIVYLNPNTLRDHPTNARLYGTYVDDDFTESCKERIYSPIHVAADKTIISGHRRKASALFHGQSEVPVIVHEDLYDDDEILELLITLNKQRVKSKDQVAREAAMLYDVEKSLAEKRRKNGVKVEEGQKTRADDKVAAATGISRTTVPAAAEVGKAILAAEESGDTLKAKELTRLVNEEGYRAAARVVNPFPNKKVGEPIGSHSTEAKALRKKLGELIRASDALLHSYNTKASRQHYEKCRKLLDDLHKEIAVWTAD